MSLYAIGDLHLRFQEGVKTPPGQLRDRAWRDHEAKFRRNCAGLIRPGDTLVLVGDHTWGRSMAECRAARSSPGATTTCSGTRRRPPG